MRAPRIRRRTWFMKKFLLFSIFAFKVFAGTPSKYTDLLPYVQKAPNQGDTVTCWFQASTGAVELLLNRKYGIKNPKKNGPYDLAESYTITADIDPNADFDIELEEIILKFNLTHESVLNKHWPFKAWNKDETINNSVWFKPDNFDELPRIKIPTIETEFLFIRGDGKYSTEVIEEGDLEMMKKAMVKHEAPLIVNVNDDYYWHVIVIVGYDDDKRGECYGLERKKCKKGVFYVRDSFGKHIEARSYEWFEMKGNTAFVVKFKK